MRLPLQVVDCSTGVKCPDTPGESAMVCACQEGYYYQPQTAAGTRL